MAVHSKTVFRPGGSVRRNIPKLGGKSDNAVSGINGSYFGVDFGAQTTAKDSGSIRWKPEWVCKSTEDMKPVRSGEPSRNIIHHGSTYKIEMDAYGSNKKKTGNQ